MFAKLDEFGILDVIVVDDYWNRKVLHGLEIEQRAVYVADRPALCAALQSAAGPMLHAAQLRFERHPSVHKVWGARNSSRQ